METGIKFNRKTNATTFRLMTARFDGRCVYNCGRPLLAGMEIVYDSYERSTQHADCCPFLADLKAN